MDLARIKALELENDKIRIISAKMATLRSGVGSGPVVDDKQSSVGYGCDPGDSDSQSDRGERVLLGR